MDALIKEAFAQQVLDPDIHTERFLNSLPEFVSTARISLPFALSRMAKYCTPAEVEYVRNLRKHLAEAHAGMVYVGTPDGGVPVLQRMMAIAGACLRNFIDARVLTTKEVLAAQKAGTLDAQVLCIPYFFTGKKESFLSPWEHADLHSVLISRHGTGQVTIVSVSDFDQMELALGESLAYHVKTNFHPIKVN